MVPIAYLTRIQSFSASHRLHSVKLSDEENIKTFGKCNNRNGHGHNYTVEVTVKGPVDEKTGMVMNIDDIKTIINDLIMNEMDHRNLDKDVAIFRDNNMVTTAENIAIVIFEGVRNSLPSGVTLHKIKLHETDKNVVTYKGEKL